MEPVIFLDTHVVVWLYAGHLELFPERALADLESHRLTVSPIVSLEMQHLHEIDRLSVTAEVITGQLKESIGLEVSDLPFAKVIAASLANAWTRDPFDRIITAQASLGG